jgi:cytochrome c-type biogenesis protein
MFTDYIHAFLGGVGVSFTPCVYPLIPIVVSYIGVKDGATKRRRGFILSFTYVTGMAITYSALGLLASLTGTIFGSISAHPVTQLSVGIIIIFFGISMHGIFHLPTLSLIKPPVLKEKNFLSIFLLGLSSGLVASPCIAPALGTILTIIAKERRVLYGSTLLLAFAYGMGLIFILAGTSSTFLMKIPKPGKWMVYVKRIFSLVLIGIGLYFAIEGIRRM